MKTTINIHYIKHLGDVQMDLGASGDHYDTVAAAQAAADEYLATHEGYTATICRVCDDIDDDRYCYIVEDNLTEDGV